VFLSSDLGLGIGLAKMVLATSLTFNLQQAMGTAHKHAQTKVEVSWFERRTETRQTNGKNYGWTNTADRITFPLRRSVNVDVMQIKNESVPKIIINDTKIFFLKLQSAFW